MSDFLLRCTVQDDRTLSCSLASEAPRAAGRSAVPRRSDFTVDRPFELYGTLVRRDGVAVDFNTLDLFVRGMRTNADKYEYEIRHGRRLVDVRRNLPLMRHDEEVTVNGVLYNVKLHSDYRYFY